MSVQRVSIGVDDPKLYRIITDVTGGINTRVHKTKIGDNQAVTLSNVDLDTAGQRQKRRGYDAIADEVGSYASTSLVDFARQGDTDYILMSEGQNIRSWTTPNASWTTIKNGLTVGAEAAMIQVKESGLSPDDVIIFQNGSDNAQRIHIDGSEVVAIQDLGSTAGTGNDSPPKSTVMCWYGNRLWALKDDRLYFSDAYPADYATAFDTTTGWFRIPVGEERALVATRDLGIIVMGREQIWGLAPSIVPDPTADKPQPITTSYGCASGKTAVNVGDDIFYLSYDGVRSLRRTEQDKLQTGASYPLSWNLKDEIDGINWAYAHKARAVYFKNRYILAVPTGASTVCNKILCYYPALSCWTTWTLSVADFVVHQIAGSETLFFTDATSGQMYEMFASTTDDGSAIVMQEVTRDETFGQPMTKKVGGWIEVECSAAGNGNTLSVEAAVDGGTFSQIGTISLTSPSAPALPVPLPFTLADRYVVREKFPIDTLGAFRSLQLKVTNSDANTDDIVIYSINITTFNESLEDE